MHPAYLETRFHTDSQPDHWPPAFAIITAFATTGETWSLIPTHAAQRAQPALAFPRSSRRAPGTPPTDNAALGGDALVLQAAHFDEELIAEGEIAGASMANEIEGT